MGVRVASQMKTSRIARSIFEAFVYLRAATDRVKRMERRAIGIGTSRRRQTAVSTKGAEQVQQLRAAAGADQFDDLAFVLRRQALDLTERFFPLRREKQR